MRNTYLLVAAASLIVLSCKKDTKDLPADQPATATDMVICLTDAWTPDQYIIGNGNSPGLVYNNKVYFFNRWSDDPSSPENTVTIYDGTDWQIKQSNIPDYFSFGTDIQFVIGNKGYLGKTTGGFYQYNFITNTWSQKANFPGTPRQSTANFSIGTKGYVVGGYSFINNSALNYNDTWEYNQSTNAWTQKADFSIFGKSAMTGFSIGNKGYIVNGVRAFNYPYDDIYSRSLVEYNPATDTWVNKASFPGEARTMTMAFLIDGFAYVGAGKTSTGEFKDFYKYNQGNNSWTQVRSIGVDIPGNTDCMLAFTLNSKGYVEIQRGRHSYIRKIQACLLYRAANTNTG